MPQALIPTSFDEAAGLLAAAAGEGRTVRIAGGGSKEAWGRQPEAPDLVLATSALNRIVEHNDGDLTAVLEAGVPLHAAQRTFASRGQMLALDPLLGPNHEATIGGIVATGDSGPLRHRYGAPRDLIVGMTVALSDGTIARSGGKVIKNVAGYDLGKLFCGSFGTLGLILSVNVRLHPLPGATVTALGVGADPELLSGAARDLAAAPLELEALDVAWRDGRGGLLARCGGVEARRRGERAAAWMRQAGLAQVDLVEDDAALWARQRSGQRSTGRLLVRVAARPTALAHVLGAATASGATLVGRAALGHSFLELSPEALATLEAGLPTGVHRVLLDAPPGLRRSVDPWGARPEPGTLDLMERVKLRFDPARVCNPGVFVGGI